MYSGGGRTRYNLDGYLSYSSEYDDKSRSYTQFYRNGILEAVEGKLLTSRGETPTIPSLSYDETLINALKDYLSIFKSLSVEPPIFVFLGLLGVKGYSMAVRHSSFFTERHEIDRDILLIPEVIIESYDNNPDEILKPCLDSIWNACGYPRDLYYNDKGKWAPPR